MESFSEASGSFRGSRNNKNAKVGVLKAFQITSAKALPGPPLRRFYFLKASGNIWKSSQKSSSATVAHTLSPCSTQRISMNLFLFVFVHKLSESFQETSASFQGSRQIHLTFLRKLPGKLLGNFQEHPGTLSMLMFLRRARLLGEWISLQEGRLFLECDVYIFIYIYIAYIYICLVSYKS